MKQWGRSLVMTGLAVGLAAQGVWAADYPGSDDDRAEIQALKARLERLEQRVSSGGGSSAAAGDAGASGVQLPSALSNVNLSGFVDTTFTYNFNEPKNRVNSLRVFDNRAGDFMLNNVELAVEKVASDDSPMGFRTDLHFGSDAEVTGSVTTGLGSTTDELDIQQGYVEYLAPVGTGLNVKAGKMTTLHGAEVTESKDNWNISRSFMFGFAEPLTHTGVRTSYAVSDMLTLTAGVNNGWDVVDDNNKAKTFEFGASAVPMENLSWAGAYTVGAEQASDSHDLRHFFSTVVGYTPMEELSLKLAADYGFEEDAVLETGGGNASWWGLAAYAKYNVTDVWSLAGRFEVFYDQDGVRLLSPSAGTGSGGGFTGSAQADIDVQALTLTTEYKLHPNLIARAEYRFDKADETVFGHDQSLDDYQNTVAFQLVAPF
jgi:hypothetical protein